MIDLLPTRPTREGGGPARWDIVGLAPWRPRLAVVLLGLALAILLPALGLGVAAYWQAAAGHREAAEGRLRDTARALGLVVDREFATVAATLKAFATSPAVGPEPPGTLDLAALQAQARRLAEGFGAPVQVVWPDGAQVLDTLRPPGEALPQAASMDAFARAIETNDTVVGDLVIDPVSGLRVFAVVTPIRDAAGRPMLLAAGLILAERLHRLLAAQGLPEDSFAAVTDARAVLVARSDASHETLAGQPVPPADADHFMGRTEGLYRGVARDGSQRIFAFHAAASAPGWTVFVARGAADFDTEWRAPLRALGWGGALAIGLGTILALLGARAILRPVEQLREVAAALGAGHPGLSAAALLPAPVAELEALRRGFAEAEAALARRVGDLAALAAASPAGLLRSDAGGRVQEANDAALRILGVGRDALTARRLRWDELTPPEWLAADNRAIAEAVAAPEGRCRPYEKEFLRPDGTRVPVLVSFAFLDRTRGEAAAFVLDLTELRQREATLREREAVLRLFVEQAPAAIAMFDAGMRYLAASRRYVQDYALPVEGPEALVGRSHDDLFPATPRRWREAHRRVLAGETLSAEDDLVPRADGRTDRVRWQMAPWFRADGGIGGALLSTEVVTERVEAERRLAASEARWRALFASMREGFLLCELLRDATGRPRDFRFLEVNDAWERETGLPRDVVLGRPAQESIPGLEPVWLATYAGVVDTGEPAHVEHYAAPLGRWFEAHAYRTEGDQFAVLLFDVTARKRAEEEHAAAEARQAYRLRLAELLRDAADPEAAMGGAAALLGAKLGVAQLGFGEVDTAERVVTVRRDWNDGRSPSVTGRWRMDDFGPALIRELMTGATVAIPDIRQDPRTALPAVVAAYEGIGTRAILDVPLMRDGRLVAMLFTHHPEPRAWTGAEIALAEETCARVWAAVERIRAEHALRDSEATLSAVLDALPVGLLIVDAAGGLVRDNAVHRTLWGGSWETRWGGDDAQWIGTWPKTGQRLARTEWPLERAVLHGETVQGVEIECQRLGSDERRMIMVNAAPLRDAKGRITGAVAAQLDVTARAAAERALAESEARLRVALDGAGLGAWSFDVRTGTVHWDARTRAIFGVGPEEGLSYDRVVWDIVHIDDRARVHAAANAAFDPAGGGSYVIEHRIVRPDGTIRWVSVNGRTSFAGAEAVMMSGTVADVTERVAAAAELAATAERLRLAIEAAELGVLAWDLRGGSLLLSDRCRALYGLADVAEPDFDVLLGAIHPDDRGAVEEAIAQALRDRRDFDLEHRLADEAGAPRWLRLRVRAEAGADGAVVGLRGVVMDVSAQKRAELVLKDDKDRLEAAVAERTSALSLAAAELRAEMQRREKAQAALGEAQKLEALGQLTGGIAHDFNNVLAAVMGSLRLIAKRAGGDARILDLARSGEGAAERAAALVRQLLAFARREDVAPAALDPEELLAGAQELVRRGVGAGIDVAVEAASGAWPVMADRHRLEVALLNLAINSRDAMDGAGSITIAARNVPATAADRPPGLRDGLDCVVLSVRDTGPGMPPEVLARATEPFFTTKPRGKGTGLGLAMVQGFAQQSGGAMRIMSTPGAGTTVEIWLLRAAKAPDAEAAPDEALDAALHGRATVLVVDDDDAVRLVTASELRDLGYDVIEANSAEAGLVQALAAERLDLVVTDLVMPGAGGRDLAERLRAGRPGVPVLFVTGFAEDRAALGGEVVLAKPFAPAALGGEVLRALGRLPPQDGLFRLIRSPALRESYLAWRRLRQAGGEGLPAPDALPPGMPWEDDGFLVALEERPGGPAFRFVRLGAALAARLGRDMAGEVFEAAGGGGHEALAGLAEIFERCARSGVPCHDYARFRLGDDGGTEFLERLLLPLSRHGGLAPTHLLGVAVFQALTE